MKKRNVLSLILIIGVFIFCGSLSGMIINFSKAASVTDLSSSATVTDFTIYKSDSTVADSDKGDTYSNYSNFLSGGEACKIKTNINVNLTSGTISNGDTVTLNFINYFGYVTIGDSPLYDSSGITQIGTWKVVNAKLIIIFNNNAAGSTNVNVSVTTGQNIIRGGGFPTNKVIDLSIGNKIKKYAFKASPKSYVGNNVYFNSFINNSSNYIASIFNDIARSEITKLYASGGTNYTVVHNVIYENSFDSEIQLGAFHIYGWGYSVMSPTDTRLGYPNDISVQVDNKFTKLEQNSNENYADFKTRIKANTLSYGVYKESTGKTKLIINFGNIGDNGLKYLDVLEEEVGNKLHSGNPNYTTDEEAQVVNNILGNNNVINGNIANYRILFYTTYSTVIENTTVSNTSTISSDEVNTSSTVTITLKPVSGLADPGAKQSVKLLKSDKETKYAIEGAKFKLQRQNGSNWEDYTAGGQTLEKATDSNGTVEFTSLNDGIYRFVETKAVGYDLSKVLYDKTTFTIASTDTEGKVIKATNEKYKYNITYNITSTDNPTDVTKPASEVVSYGTKYTANDLVSNEHYTFSGWYTDSNYTTKYKNETAITKDTTLYGKWSKDTNTVTYKWVSVDNPSDVTIPSGENVVYGEKYTAKTQSKSSEHYTFDGWYTNKECTTKYKNETAITSPIVLYGKWTKDVVTITYDFLNGAPEGVNLPGEVLINYGTSYTAEVISDAGDKYIFNGWYLDKECTKKYEDGTEITENTKLYGKWNLITDNTNPHTGNNYLILYGILMIISIIISTYSVIALRKEKGEVI